MRTPLGSATADRLTETMQRLAYLAVVAGLISGFVAWISGRHAARPNIVVILIDTLRADHLGAYGYPRPTSPAIDEIAKTSVVFERAYSTAPWTNPTIATLFTGYYPQELFPVAPHRLAIHQALPLAVDTLAERLHAAGYRTAALVDHPGIGPGLHYDQGFDVLVRLFHEAGVSAWGVTDPSFVFEQVDRQFGSATSPFFLYLHLVYPHRPYVAPADYQQMFGPRFTRLGPKQRDGVINAYDAEIRFTDDLIGRIAGSLRQRRLWDETCVVILSDHGEGFWEHGVAEHGNSLFDELLHVPLILHPPAARGLAPERVARPVSLVDFWPTMLDLAGVDLPEPLRTRSLIRGGDSDRPIFSESKHSRYLGESAVRSRGLKYIGDLEHGALFDLQADPGESNPLPGRPEVRAEMVAQLRQHQDSALAMRHHWGGEERPVDENTLQRLRALGYDD